MSGENETPDEGQDENDLSLEQQIEQVEEAADAVAEAIEAGDTDRAANILEQLEQWRQNLSSTLEKAKPSPELTGALTEIRSLRSELDALKAPPKPSPSPTPSDPQPPTPSPTPTPTPKPLSDGSPMEHPESGEPEDQPEPPPRPSPRQQRRAI